MSIYSESCWWVYARLSPSKTCRNRATSWWQLPMAPNVKQCWTAQSPAVLLVSLSQARFFSLSKSNECIAPAQYYFCCRCLLIEPFPESALNEEAGKLLLENYEEYAKHAKLMTSIHAQPPKRSACCLTPLLRCLFGQSLCH